MIDVQHDAILVLAALVAPTCRKTSIGGNQLLATREVGFLHLDSVGWSSRVSSIYIGAVGRHPNRECHVGRLTPQAALCRQSHFASSLVRKCRATSQRLWLNLLSGVLQVRHHDRTQAVVPREERLDTASDEDGRSHVHGCQEHSGLASLYRFLNLSLCASEEKDSELFVHVSRCPSLLGPCCCMQWNSTHHGKRRRLTRLHRPHV